MNSTQAWLTRNTHGVFVNGTDSNETQNVRKQHFLLNYDASSCGHIFLYIKLLCLSVCFSGCKFYIKLWFYMVR